MNDRVAIVTGGGRGLGRALALAPAEAGAAVCVAGRTASALEETASLIQERGGRAIAAPTDVLSEEAVEAMVESTAAALGGVDILVNNSGVLGDGPILETSLEEWRRVVDTNLTGTFLCCRAVAPRMIEQGSGKVVNVASMWGFRGVPRMASYAASKAAVISLTASLALEWASFGIQVNAVAPGYFETDMNATARADQEVSARIVKRIPARRMGRPEELAPLVLYLASSDSDFVTGETIVIDGGQLAA